MGGPSFQLNYDEIQCLELILGMIESNNWQTFKHAILSNPSVFQSFYRTISQSTELNGMTILHSCVRFNPPPSIIKLLLELVPESPSCFDCLQRTPLHVAVGTRASLPVITLLAEAFPAACDIQDKDGKTPLHLACHSSCELFVRDQCTEKVPPDYEVVELLMRVSPSSILLEDHNEMSPLEHAIFSDAPIEVVKLLQLATRNQCEAREREDNNTRSPTLSYTISVLISSDNRDGDRRGTFIPVGKGKLARRRLAVWRSRTV